MTALHVVLLLGLSIAFEGQFLHQGLNLMDEGWPLHAASQLERGGTLYDDVFWVFPPGHLLAARIAHAFDPPGMVAARTIYAGFCVALCIAIYFAARRIMAPEFALLAGAMLAIAAPQSHVEHHLFGYRYLVWSVVALLFFHLRLARDDPRWLLAAGIAAGSGLLFRLTPGFAVSAGIGVGLMAASRDWRRWLRDGLWYGAGIAIVALPMLIALQATVGLSKAWIEMVAIPVEMTALQSLSIPDLVAPEGSRRGLILSFVTLAFRLYLLLCVGLLGVLLVRWARAVRDRRPFNDAFLLAFVLFGGVFYVRSLGRSDWPHLDSALPPVIVLIAWCASRLPGWLPRNLRTRVAAKGAIAIAVFAVWVLISGSDRAFLRPSPLMGGTLLQSAGERILVHPRSEGRTVDQLVPAIRGRTGADDTVLVMSHAPLLYVLSDRQGPGYRDVVMPGTFRSVEEQRSFIERLEASRPALVVVPTRNFDGMPARGLSRTAPELLRWVEAHYRPAATVAHYRLWVPIPGV